ncbi:MAG TPA: hypothetical protein VFA07_00395 [Chthonomonadaceae bacterium]|nr:hypothetical protein [Chthonomonadaceae bacterium]
MMGQAGKARRVRWQGLVWLLPLLCAGGVVYILYFRHRPECFPGGFSGDVGQIQDGQKYWLSGNTILAQSVTGGTIREVVREDTRAEVDAVAGIQITGGSVFYFAMSPSRRPVKNPGGLRPSPFPASRFLGVYRASPHKASSQELSREKQVVLPVSQTLTESTGRFRSVPVQGGAPRDLTARIEGSACLAGGYAYWIQKRPDGMVQIASGGVTWEEMTGHSDLMATTLADGSLHKLSTVLPMNSVLLAGPNGVFWTEPRPFPHSGQDLYYYRAGDAKLYTILDYRGDPFGPPTEFKDRLYWFATNKPPHWPNLDWSADRLVSARLDGSDLREVFLPAARMRFPVLWRLRSSFLQVYRGHLYGLFRDQPSGVSPVLGNPRYLCRIDPDRSDPVEDVFTLPSGSANCTVDGDSFYFTHLEEDRPFLDRLTGDEAHIGYKQTLCRIRLPD